MAITIPCSESQAIGSEECLARADALIEVEDFDSLAEAAPLLRQVSNDRSLIVDALNARIEACLQDAGRQDLGPAQVIFLGRGRKCYLRANIWPSPTDISQSSVHQGQLAYGIAHDHNYDFLTTIHCGTGYVTEIYEYDYEKLSGAVGEKFECTFLERTHFHGDTVMVYRASKDLHVQLPPEDMTISINLMINNPRSRTREQFFFDLERGVISGYPPETDNSRRASIVQLAGMLGNEETVGLLLDLGTHHPSRRTRLAAFESVERLAPDRRLEIWGTAVKDPEALVCRSARRHLDQINAE